MTQGKLLIVDDELSVRDSLAKWFTEEGYEDVYKRQIMVRMALATSS